MPSRNLDSSGEEVLPVVVGIDLGTTNCAISRFVANNTIECYPLEGREPLLPSALFMGDQFAYGRQALELGLEKPDLLVEAFKRDMGEPHFHRKIRNHWVPPEVLSALLLDEIRARFSKQVEGPCKAVITVPAYFDERRRKATFEAGRLAGLQVTDIVNEPVAAALAELFHSGKLLPKNQSFSKMMVYDLGGGTFDVSVLEVDGAEITTLSSDGDVRLGGRDFDERIVDFISDRFMKQHGIDPRADFGVAQRLWQLAEKAKRELTTNPTAQVSCSFAGMQLDVPITREEFEHLIDPFIERSLDTSLDALEQAGLEWSDMDQILLVGGSSRIPLVAERIAEAAMKKPTLARAPDLAVSMGAALFAARQAFSKIVPLKVVNVNAHSIGIAGVDVNTGRPLNRIIIPRNSRLPASRRQKFVTKAANQRSVDVKIVEGENEDPRYCIPIGKCIATLSPDLPARTEVLVTCRVSTNGTLSVSCVVPLTQESAHAEIRRDGLLELESLPIWRDRLLRGVSHTIEETPDLPMVPPVASPDRTDLDEVTRRIDYLCQLIGERAMTASLPPVMRGQQESLRKAQREYTAIRHLLTEVRRQLAKSQDNLERTKLQSAAAAIRSYLAESEKLFIYSRIAFGAGCVAAGCAPASVTPEAEEAASLKQTLQNWQLN